MGHRVISWIFQDQFRFAPKIQQGSCLIPIHLHLYAKQSPTGLLYSSALFISELTEPAEIDVTKETTRVSDDIMKDMISTSRENDETHRNDFLIPVLSSSIYHVQVLIGGDHENILQRIDAAFHTRTSSYLIRRDVLPSGIYILPCDKKPSLVDANGAEMIFEGVATIRLQVGGRSMLVDFLVASKLSVPLILGTSFIDEHVEANFPRELRILLKDMTEVAIAQTSAGTVPVNLPETISYPLIRSLSLL
jgi:hypothetical protein